MIEFDFYETILAYLNLNEIRIWQKRMKNSNKNKVYTDISNFEQNMLILNELDDQFVCCKDVV